MYTTDIITADGISERLVDKNVKLTVLESVDSTNTYLKNSITAASREGEIVIALAQTRGRGRLGRNFHSPSDSGIYMSILLKPTLPPEKAVLITAAAAVAVCEACEELGSHMAEIKWVNDVYIDSKKICGILTEGVINPENSGFEYAILGIGVNVYPPSGGFAEEIKDIAGAAFQNGRAGLREQLASEIVNRFMAYYADLKDKTFLSEYQKRCFTVGKEVTVISANSSKYAKALEVDGDCRMLVEYSDGRREYISSGEISIKPKK